MLEARQLLTQLATSAPELELQVVALHRIDGMSQPQVGQALEISERSVRRLLTRFDERVAAWRTRAEATP